MTGSGGVTVGTGGVGGTGGVVSLEDVIGAGAVLREILALGGKWMLSDAAQVAMGCFASARVDLRAALAGSQGGRNVKAAGLEPDIAFAARLNVYDVLGKVERAPLRVVRVL